MRLISALLVALAASLAPVARIAAEEAPAVADASAPAEAPPPKDPPHEQAPAKGSPHEQAPTKAPAEKSPPHEAGQGKASPPEVPRGKDSPPEAPPEQAARPSEKSPAVPDSMPPARVAEPDVPVPGEVRPDSGASTKKSVVESAPKAGANTAAGAAKPATPKQRARPRAPTLAKGSAPATRPPAKASSGGAGSSPPKASPDPARPPEPISEKDRVAGELDRTDRAVARTRAKIGVGRNPRAAETLSSADELQGDAREAFRLSQYVRAERLTHAARDYLDRALRLIGPARDDPEYVEGLLKRTDDAIDRAEEVLDDGPISASDRRVFASLKRRQRDARKVFKDGKVSAAYTETLAVREGVLDLLRKAERLPVPESVAKRAVKGAERTLEQATKEIRDSRAAEANRLLRLGREHLGKARHSLARRDYRAALLQAKIVERNAERALDAAHTRG